MTREQYKAMNGREFKGRKARTLREITTGVMRIAAGSTVTITRKFQGFNVETERCSSCGVSFTAHRVNWEALDLINDGVGKFETLGERDARAGA